MADFQFLRLEKPDVMRYLPKFLAEDKQFKNVQDSLNLEHEKERQALIDLASQFFVDTATWGLNAWERVYQTSPPAGAGYDLRRAMLRAKMLGRQTMTKANMELLINQFTADKDAYIEECVAPGTYCLRFPSAIKYLEQLATVILEMSPAHLECIMRLEKDKADTMRYIGAMPCSYIRHEVCQLPAQSASSKAVIYRGSVTALAVRHSSTQLTAMDSIISAKIYRGAGGTLYKKHYSYQQSEEE